MKIILIILMLLAPLFGQMTGEGNLKEMFMEDKLDQFKGAEQFEKASIPYTTKIDPDIYYPGPGDVYLFKILPFQGKSEYIMVDPEGMLILPRSYGMINTDNKNLTQLRKDISDLINDEDDSKSVLLSLYKPRSIVIKVSGDILQEGVLTLLSNMTVGDVLNYIENMDKQRNVTQTMISKQYNDYANKQFRDNLDLSGDFPRNNIFKERNILLIRDGKSKIIDLASADYIDKGSDPFIMEGDEIIVPKMNQSKNYYTVVGEVNQPSNISHRNGDDIELALKLAGGLKPNADPNNSYIFLPDGTKTKVRFDENGNLGDFNPEIQSGTTILIGNKLEEKDANYGLVNVTGQVFNQGNFVIEKGETTLKNIIEMAGGLKSEACLSLARVINYKEIEDKDFVMQQGLKEKLQYFNLSVDDTLLINLEYQMMQPRLSINFDEILNSEDQNVLLKDGDIIEIPECPTRTYVMGRVKNPGYIDFTPGKHPDWYINKTGGLVESADDDRARIIRGGTNVWQEIDKNTIVMPGDMLYIPSEPMVSRINKVQEYAAIAAILGSIGAIGFFIIQLVEFGK